MALTWSDVLELVRLRIQDTSTTNQAISDDELLIVNNQALLDWHEAFDDRVFWDPATSTGLQWGAGDAAVTRKITTAADYTKLFSIHYELTETSTTKGVELERIELPEMFYLQGVEALAGDPAFYAVERAAATRVAGNPTSSDVGKWYVYLYPLHPGGFVTALSARVRRAPALMTGNASVYDLTDAEAYHIGTVVSARASTLLNQPQEFIDNIWRELPDAWQQKMNRHVEASTAPNRRPAEAPL